jgi:hypothetical protein
MEQIGRRETRLGVVLGSIGALLGTSMLVALAVVAVVKVVAGK